MFREFTDLYFQGLAKCYEEVPREKLATVLEILLQTHRQGRKVFILGNGGSAATASHAACDLGKGTATAGRPRLRVISLADNMALLSAWANDASYEVVFKEQLENLLEPGDVVLAISASGNSPNILRAMEYAKKHGAVTIGFAGFGGGKLKELVDVDITVSSQNYGQVEDLHLTLNHIVSQYLKQRFSAEANEIEEITPQLPSSNDILRFFFSEPPTDGSSPAIFLDRDGVINERIDGGYVTQWSQFRFVEGIEQALTELAALKVPILVTSNQAGVGKGLVSAETLAEITKRFVSELRKEGARVDAVYYCPHIAEARCSCRKPAPDLLRQASEDWRIDLSQSVLVGDSPNDLQAAQASRCRAILLANHDGNSLSNELSNHQAMTVHNTAEIAAGIRQLLQGQDQR